MSALMLLIIAGCVAGYIWFEKKCWGKKRRLMMKMFAVSECFVLSGS